MTGLNTSRIVSKDTRGQDKFFTRLFRLEANSKSESETERERESMETGKIGQGGKNS